MKILLINPPNCGRSIPEERYGINSIKQIFRGEPLALEVLAGNLHDHDLRILDLKVEPDLLQQSLAEFSPDIVAVTGVTCEANTVVDIARECKETCGAVVIVGGSHASCDPGFFNGHGIDFVVVGLGKAALAELVAAIESGQDTSGIPGVATTAPGRPLSYNPRMFGPKDLGEETPPRYDLVARYRDSYVLSSLGIRLGFVASAMGCPYSCSFCCIAPITGGRYLTQSIASVVRDIQLLGEMPVIRLVDANTFGDPDHARRLAEAIAGAGIRKHFLVDVRADTVVRHLELMQLWKETGLRSVVIGFEEISDGELLFLNKASSVAMNDEAIRILHELGVTIVGDFIISPDYGAADFEALGSYVETRGIDLPIFTVLTPLPGTPLQRQLQDRIVVNDLDYYTLTNAVIPTRLAEKKFYEEYAALTKVFHAKARL